MIKQLPTVQSPTSLEDNVFQALLSAIVAGHFEPGKPLNALEIAHQLNVSRTPVTNSLGRLRELGVLVASRRGYTVVPPLSLSDLDNLYAVRSVLEGLAASTAATKISADQLSQLGDDLRETLELIAKVGSLANLQGPERFHRTILEVAGNPRLSHFHDQNDLHIRRYLHVALAKESAEQLKEGLEEHKAVLDALCAHDPQEAERLARYHVIRSRDRLAATLQTLNAPAPLSPSNVPSTREARVRKS